MDHLKMQKWGFRILRIGLALIFIWFGKEQLMNPGSWIGYVPSWAESIFPNTEKLVLLNGLFELVAAFLLIMNVFTRVVALILAVHLLVIALAIGINPVGVRDIGLSIAALSLALVHPPKAYTRAE